MSLKPRPNQSPPLKTLILVRHAHRDTTDRELDNGLSARGKEQMQSFTEGFIAEYAGRYKDAPTLFASPKARCIETLEGLSRKYKTKIHIEPMLGEPTNTESHQDYIKRIHSYLDQLLASRDLAAVTVLCSHGDWLPFALKHLTGIEADFEKGSWARIKLEPHPELVAIERARPR